MGHKDQLTFEQNVGRHDQCSSWYVWDLRPDLQVCSAPVVCVVFSEISPKLYHWLKLWFANAGWSPIATNFTWWWGVGNQGIKKDWMHATCNHDVTHSNLNFECNCHSNMHHSPILQVCQQLCPSFSHQVLVIGSQPRACCAHMLPPVFGCPQGRQLLFWC